TKSFKSDCFAEEGVEKLKKQVEEARRTRKFYSAPTISAKKVVVLDLKKIKVNNGQNATGSNVTSSW
ncbi:19311_t:CDS:1, partial [Gigaspora rosea]